MLCIQRVLLVVGLHVVCTEGSAYCRIACCVYRGYCAAAGRVQDEIVGGSLTRDDVMSVY
jgi:hypothetical protein